MSIAQRGRFPCFDTSMFPSTVRHSSRTQSIWVLALAGTLGFQIAFITVWPPYRLFVLTLAVIDTREDYRRQAGKRVRRSCPG